MPVQNHFAYRDRNVFSRFVGHGFFHILLSKFRQIHSCQKTVFKRDRYDSFCGFNLRLAYYVLQSLNHLPTDPSPYLARESSPYVSNKARSFSFLSCTTLIEEEPMSTPKNLASWIKNPEALLRPNPSNIVESAIVHNSNI